MDLRATLTPAEWQAMVKLRGRRAMDPLADWFAEHIGLPMRYKAAPGDEAVIVKAATINATHLICELQHVRVGEGDTVERLADREVRGFELLRPPPFWVQPPLGRALRAHAKRPRATSDAAGDPRPLGSPDGDGEAQGPTPGSSSPASDCDGSPASDA